MADDFVGRDEEREPGDKAERVWEGGLGGRRFRMRWDRGPGRAGFHFQGPFTGGDESETMSSIHRRRAESGTSSHLASCIDAPSDSDVLHAS